MPGGSGALSALPPCSSRRVAWRKLSHPKQGVKGEENRSGAKGKGRTCRNRAWGGRGLGGGRRGAAEVLGLDHGILSLLRREGKAICQIPPLIGARKKYLTPCGRNAWCQRVRLAQNGAASDYQDWKLQPAFAPRLQALGKEGAHKRNDLERQKSSPPSLHHTLGIWTQKPHLSRV